MIHNDVINVACIKLAATMSYVTDYVMKKYQCKRGDFLLFKTTLYKLKIKNLIKKEVNWDNSI